MAASQPDAPWTTRRLLVWTTERFEKARLDSPRLAAEMLLAHVLGVERLKLYMDPQRPSSELERATFRSLVARALAHEPVDYLVGHAVFFSMLFKVTPAVLIPRPSTEALVEHIIQHARRTPGFASPLIADIGTGSGCIAIALAKQISNARVLATDTSADALDVAKENAQAHGASDRIEFREGDLLAPLKGDPHQRLHYLVSNPPYISDEEWAHVEHNVKEHEPEGALRGGVDGLRYLRPLIADGPAMLRDPGQLVLEVASSQKAALLELCKANPRLHDPILLPDHEALPRVLVANAR